MLVEDPLAPRTDDGGGHSIHASEPVCACICAPVAVVIARRCAAAGAVLPLEEEVGDISSSRGADRAEVGGLRGGNNSGCGDAESSDAGCAAAAGSCSSFPFPPLPPALGALRLGCMGEGGESAELADGAGLADDVGELSSDDEPEEGAVPEEDGATAAAALAAFEFAAAFEEEAAVWAVDAAAVFVACVDDAAWLLAAAAAAAATAADPAAVAMMGCCCCRLQKGSGAGEANGKTSESDGALSRGSGSHTPLWGAVTRSCRVLSQRLSRSQEPMSRS